MWFVRTGYEPALDAALRWRYVTAAVGLSTLVLSGGLALGGWANFQFAPSVENEFMTASITMPLGTPAAATSEAVARFEAGAARLRARLERETGSDYFRHVATTIGDQPVQARGGGGVGRINDIVAAGNIGEITIELAPTETPLAHQRAARHPVARGDRRGPGSGRDRFPHVAAERRRGRGRGALRAGPRSSAGRRRRAQGAVGRVRGRLCDRRFHSYGQGGDAARHPAAAETLGLTLQDLGRQVRQAFYGEEAQRIQRGRDDVRVMVRYPREQRRSLGNLENMRVRTPEGGEVPFSQVALVEPGRGFASIRRIDRSRAVNVTASVDPRIASTSDLVADLRERLLPQVLAEFPDVFYRFRGNQEAQEGSRERPAGGVPAGADHDLRLLAIPLRSYAQPLIIMGAIPFGLVGALWGHLLMGLDVTYTSMLGFVALTGVVVNDSLIMVDFINRERKLAAGADDPGEPPAGRPAIRRGRSRTRHPPGRRPAVPSHRPHVPDHLRRPGADDGRPQHAGRVPDPDGGLAGLRRTVRHLHHPVSGAGRVRDSRRRAASAAVGVGIARRRAARVPSCLGRLTRRASVNGGRRAAPA